MKIFVINRHGHEFSGHTDYYITDAGLVLLGGIAVIVAVLVSVFHR